LELLRTLVQHRSIIRVSHKGWNRQPETIVVFPWRGFAMKKLFILCLSFGLCVSTVAFARGGLGMHHSSSGGAFGSSAAAPGTNSLGTALSSDDPGSGRKTKGPALGTGNPAVDREDAKVARMVRSICRGC
jgi:hypothetical protein